MPLSLGSGCLDGCVELSAALVEVVCVPGFGNVVWISWLLSIALSLWRCTVEEVDEDTEDDEFLTIGFVDGKEEASSW